MSNAEHGAIFELLSRHDTILRKVEEIPGRGSHDDQVDEARAGRNAPDACASDGSSP